MRKVSIALGLFAVAGIFQFCSSSKKAASAASAVTYEANIKPVIQANCAPCHIAGQGNKKSLDNYANAVATADDTIERIKKNPADPGFMPMRHPKLDDATIATFENWKKGGLKEK